MAEAVEFQATAFKNGSLTLLARVVGNEGREIVQADLASAKYSVYLLDDHQPDDRTPVAGHRDVPLNVADAVFNVLQIDALWTADSLGYNFRHALDVRAQPAFPTAGRRYLVEFTLTPHSGQVILLRYRIHVI